MLKFGKKAVFKCTLAKLILLITILFVNRYQIMAVSLIQGQEANLIFPYPCDSTEVTLQQSNRAPFYRSTDGSSLSLSQDQVQRFKVQNRNNTENCSLGFTISNLMRSDQGTYISLVYKDGEILFEHTHRIWQKVDYPPGKASCVVGEDKGGDWVSIDCTANVGSLSGKIECYQDGVWMPPLTDPTHTDTLLKQTILIRKSQPAFCCSSTWIEYIERCDCNDTALYLDDAISNDPCPTISTTSIDGISDLVNNSQSFNSSNYPLPSQTTSTNANKMIKNNLEAIIIYYILVTGVIILLILNAISLCRSRQERTNDSNDESQDLTAIIIYYLLATSVVLLLILNTISYYQLINSNDEPQYLFKIIIYYILATGVVILIILNVISLYRSRKKCKNNSNDESQDPVSSNV